jgi:hypothetical protein
MYDYRGRLEAARRRISALANNRFLLSFLDQLKALGLSDVGVAKYANHLRVDKVCPFNPQTATRKNVERVIAWINRQSYKSSTKENLKVVVRKLVQYAKQGSCAPKIPVPEEVAWFSINRSEKGSRVKP